ncbi:MAG TPA: TetR/AcrR family transcriptional regulator [Alphaproteobacteria bacterium]|nr:TetR/AcrR family transcriptional regulator [Alphaproteobacteria bacterium]
MSEQTIERRSPESGTAERLLEAGISLIAEGGLRALTIRDLAARAGIAFPSVQHHFPSKGLLIDEIFSNIERRHCAVTADALAEIEPDGGEAALPEIISAVLADWCGGHRTLTIGAHEMLLAAHRDSRHARFGGGWIDGQSDVWMGLTRRLGLKLERKRVLFIVELLLGLSLMTFGCANQVEAALANNEIIRFAFADAKSKERFDPYWYRMQLARLDREELPIEDSGSTISDAGHPAAAKILDAGILIVAEEGASMLTFRGIAARAGVAIGSVTNNFQTRQKLTYSIYRHIQENITNANLRVPETTSSSDLPAPAPLPTRIAMMKRVLAGKPVLALASYDLMLAGARDPAFGPRAWRIRMTRGIYLLIRRGVIPAHPLLTQFRAHAHSLWSNAVVLLCGIRASDAAEKDNIVEQRMRVGFAHLG